VKHQLPVRVPWPPEASSQPLHGPAWDTDARKPTALATGAAEVFDEDGISDADLPFLPAEQYNSVWEAILGHL
jgi:hypothetical protein